MTELMKRYEAETGKSSTQTITDGLDIWHYEYIAWLENQVLDGKTIEKFQEIIRNQCDEISSLRAQLTWRPVSEEPTLKEMGKILCKNNDMKISVELWGIALEDWEDFVERLNIVSWLPIPPALE